MNIVKFIGVFIILLLAFFSKTSKSQCTWYLNINGNDTNNCNSIATPCQSLQGVVNKSNPSCSNGTIQIYIAQGTYVGALNRAASIYNRTVQLIGVAVGQVIFNLESKDRLLHAFNGFIEIYNISVINGNSSSNGGVLVLTSTPSLIQDSTFSNSFANTSGGAIYSDSSVSLNGVTISYCTSFYGGAVAALAVTVTNSHFINNTAQEGGAIYANETTILGSSFIANSGVIGGGLYSGPSSWTVLINSVFTANTAPNGGGGIFVSNVDLLQINNCNFLSNSAYDFLGGAISISTNAFANITLQSVLINNNTADIGGGIHLDAGMASNVLLASLIFRNNVASTHGGALDFGATGNVTINMRNVTIEYNSANVHGGGINCYNTVPIQASAVTFFQNSGANCPLADVAGDCTGSFTNCPSSVTSANCSSCLGGNCLIDGSQMVHCFSSQKYSSACYCALPPSTPSPDNLPLIIGVVVGGTAALLLFFGTIYYCRCRTDYTQMG